jgi:hypothetical protein
LKKLLNPLLSKKSKISRDDKFRLYLSVIRPSLLYGCEIFGNTSIANRNKLETFQNKTIRSIADQPRLIPVHEIRSAHCIPTVHECIRSQAERLLHSLPNSTLTEHLWDGPLDRQTKYRRTKEILFR